MGDPYLIYYKILCPYDLQHLGVCNLYMKLDLTFQSGTKFLEFGKMS